MAKKKRTSIRTAAGTTQQAFQARMQALCDDPLRVLPQGDLSAKPLVKAKAGLERLAAGKPGFLDKRDKGIVGAVYHSMQLAERDGFPRLLDHKIAGKRRFFLTVGHVDRAVTMGVQNHDDAIALLQSYRAMAADNGLHFFAGPDLACTGTVAEPPEAWLKAVAKAADIHLQDGACKHGGDGIVFTFYDGPSLHACTKCADPLHAMLKIRYAGPRKRQPFEVQVTKDDERVDPEKEDLAAYRAGVKTARELLQTLA